jgi:hypothetical protein
LVAQGSIYLQAKGWFFNAQVMLCFNGHYSGPFYEYNILQPGYNKAGELEAMIAIIVKVLIVKL